MHDIELFRENAALARRCCTTATTAADRSRYQALAAENTRRQRLAEAADRPALVFRMPTFGTFELGVKGGPIATEICDLDGAVLAWHAIAHQHAPHMTPATLLADETEYTDDNARRQIKFTFVSWLRRIRQHALASAIASGVRVVNGMVVYDPGPMAPEIIVS